MIANPKKTVQTRIERKKATRQKLIETTIDIIAKEGLSRVTLPKVAKNTGLSRGICNFHFRTKEQLLLETFQAVYQEHETAWKNALSDKEIPPVDRLSRFIRVLLIPPVADLKKVAIWLAYWGEAASRKTYLDLCSAMDREFEDAVVAVLRELPESAVAGYGMELQSIAVALTGMIDGFWVQYLIAPHRLSPENAVSACLAFLSSFFPQFREIRLRS